MNNEKNVEEYVDIGGTLYKEDEITPSVYFEYVKGLKNKLDNEDWEKIINKAISMMKKCVATGQTKMAEDLKKKVDLSLRELNAAKSGYDIFLFRKDIESYIHKVEGKAIKIIELDRYSREIPDEVIDKIIEAREIFDKLYIVFTDYANKESKKVAKERRDKDPILFGAFIDKEAAENNTIYVEDRMFFIADWVEEKCDLTLDELVRDVEKMEKKDIVYKVGSFEDEDKVKAYINSFSEKPEETTLTPESNKSILDRFKDKVKKSSTKELPPPVKKKRGRPPKKKLEE